MKMMEQKNLTELEQLIINGYPRTEEDMEIAAKCSAYNQCCFEDESAENIFEEELVK